MRRVLFLAGLLALPAAAEPLRHEVTATSAAVVTRGEDGTVQFEVRTARLLPFQAWQGTSQVLRLLTIVAEAKSRSDAEGYSPDSAVSFTLDDLDAATPRRLSAYSDPGVEGTLLGERYTAATLPGCCAAPNRHWVRVAETGRLLFTSTGPEAPGTAAWAEVPNARPALRRWAALDAAPEEAAFRTRRVVATLAYGTEEGRLFRIEIRQSRGDAADLNLELGDGARLLWLDPRAGRRAAAADSGTAGSGYPLWSLEGTPRDRSLSGFALRLVLADRRVIATIPIAADRLDWRHATLAPGILLAEAP